MPRGSTGSHARTSSSPAQPTASSSKSVRNDPETAQSGCITCRARRIRCDEEVPSCGLCRQGGFECIRTSDVASTSAMGFDGTVAKERGRLACLPCRTRKIRCAGPINDGDLESPCARCERLSISCTWKKKKATRTRGPREKSEMSPPQEEEESPPPAQPQKRRRSVNTLSPVPESSSIQSALANKAELRQLITLYFTTVHYYAYFTFIHEPSFFRLLEAGRAPRELTAVMVASTLRYACEPTPFVLARADLIFDEALKVVRERIFEGYGAIELMVMVLARSYETTRCKFSSAWLLWGHAVRMMQFLSLHIFDEAYPNAPTFRLNPLLKREALRRLAWAVFFGDTLADAGRHGVHLVTETIFRIQLPCDEASFVRDKEEVTASLNQRPPSILGKHPISSVSPFSFPQSYLSPSQPNESSGAQLGLSAHMIRAGALRRRVLHYNSLIKHSTDPPIKMLEELAVFESELKAVIAEFPDDLAYTEHNLFVHSASRTGFVGLHLLRHNCFLMLSLARLSACLKDPELADLSIQFRKDRLKHAVPCSKIIADTLRLGTNVDPFICTQAYTCLEILLFDPLRISRFDGSVDPRDPKFVGGLKAFMDLIRREFPRDGRIALLRVEACRRLTRCGFEDLLTQSDRDACRGDASGNPTAQDDDEYNFRDFDWHRSESAQNRRPSSRVPPKNDSANSLLMLHRGGGNTSSARDDKHGQRQDDTSTIGFRTAANSRANSPPYDDLDAGAVSTTLPLDRRASFAPFDGENIQGPSPNSIAAENINMALNGVDTPLASGSSMPDMRSASLGYSQPGLPQQQSHDLGFNATPTGMDQVMQNPPDHRRWMNLDYGLDFNTDPMGGIINDGFNNGSAMYAPMANYQDSGGFAGGTGAPGSNNDISMFLEQAGFASTDEIDPFSWLSRQ